MPEMDCAGFQRSVRLHRRGAGHPRPRRRAASLGVRYLRAPGRRADGRHVRAAARLSAPDALHQRVALLIQARRRRRGRRLAPSPRSAWPRSWRSRSRCRSCANPAWRMTMCRRSWRCTSALSCQGIWSTWHPRIVGASPLGSLPFAVPVADLSSGYRLEGARLDLRWPTRGRPGLPPGGPCGEPGVLPRRASGDRPSATAERGDMHVCGWCRGGTQFFAVSDLQGLSSRAFPRLARVSSG